MLIAWFANKPNNVVTGGSVSTPAGWTALTSITGQGGYTAVPASDTGNGNIFAFYKEADGSESGSLTLTLTTNHVGIGAILRLSKTSGNTWGTPVNVTTGRSTAPSATWTQTFGSDPGIAANDAVIGILSVPTDTGTVANWTAQSLTVPGCTVSNQGFESLETSTGFDFRATYRRGEISAGSSSGAPSMVQTWTGTLTNFRGPYMLIRLRDVAPPSSMVADVGFVAI